jgi:hypothetical protein
VIGHHRRRDQTDHRARRDIDRDRVAEVIEVADKEPQSQHDADGLFMQMQRCFAQEFRVSGGDALCCRRRIKAFFSFD